MNLERQMTTVLMALNLAIFIVAIGTVAWTTYRVFRVDRCPVCFWGKLRVFNASEMTQAIRNGSFHTAATLFARVHLRCQRCAEVYCRRPDGSLERTELPTTHPIEEEERI